MSGAEELCPKCGENPIDWDGCCTDCWPGYNLCADPKCEHYRCEHLDNPPGECGNGGCKCKLFVEGGTKRIVNRKEWEAIKKSWGE